MKRVIVVCEGRTEQEFVRSILYGHFLQFNKDFSQAPPLKRNTGKKSSGIDNWESIKKRLIAILRNDTTANLTTLIDYYGIQPEHNFPQWNQAHQIPNLNERLGALESAMKNDVPSDIQNRFIPYIQLHEFEALLFCERHTFNTVIPKELLIGVDELDEIFRYFPNPEDINNSKETAPSHRLERIIDGYSKITHMNIICKENGLTNIRAKCPRFNNWITQLENL